MGGWKESAYFALMIFVVIFVIAPIFNNPILQSVSLALRPLALIVIGVLIFISAFKYFLLNRPNSAKDSLIRNQPSINSIQTIKSSVVKPQSASATEPRAWSLKLIQEIEWKIFENLATAYYVEKGIRAEATSLGADGGIDIKLYQDDSDKPTSIVQCKAWYNKQVGVKEIREFLGVLTNEKIAKGFYMTSGIFSEDAISTAKNNRITLVNGEMFLLMIQRLSEDSQIINMA